MWHHQLLSNYSMSYWNNHKIYKKIYKKYLFLACFRNHGVLGLFQGLEAKLLQTILMAALMFLTYEKITAFVFHLMRVSKTWLTHWGCSKIFTVFQITFSITILQRKLLCFDSHVTKFNLRGPLSVSSLVQLIVLCLFGSRPLPEPMMENSHCCDSVATNICISHNSTVVMSCA